MYNSIIPKETFVTPVSDEALPSIHLPSMIYLKVSPLFEGQRFFNYYYNDATF